MKRLNMGRVVARFTADIPRPLRLWSAVVLGSQRRTGLKNVPVSIVAHVVGVNERRKNSLPGSSPSTESSRTREATLPSAPSKIREPATSFVGRGNRKFHSDRIGSITKIQSITAFNEVWTYDMGMTTLDTDIHFPSIVWSRYSEGAPHPKVAMPQ